MYPSTLSFTERLTLANQFRILAGLYPDSEDHYIVKAEILENGYAGNYDDIFHSLDKEKDPQLTREVHNILTMYRNINRSIASLTDEERDHLDLKKIEFKGFDANHDDHYHLATFMIEKMRLYKELEKFYLNSHGSSNLEVYRSMVNVYLDLRDNHDIQDYAVEHLNRFIEEI